MPRMPWSSRISALCSSRNALHSTHCCPSSCGMYWRGSSQIGQAPGGSSARRVLRPARFAEERSQRSSSATHSTCGVCGNMSTGRAHEPVAVVVAQALQVAGERRRVARDVDDARARSSSPSRFSALPARPGARRIDDDDVGLAGALAQLAQHLADVAGEERRVADRVQLRVLDRAGDRLLRDLDPPHRQRVRGHREADRADAAVEVVDGLAAGQPGGLARDRVELLGHLGVRLQERVRPHAEAQAADLLLDRVLAPEQLGRQVRDLGDAVVHRPVDRAHLGELGQHLDQPLAVEALAAAGDELHERLARVPALADHEMAEIALVRLLVVRRQLLLARPVAIDCGSRCRGRSSASTSRSRAPRPSGPARCKPSVGPSSSSANEYSILLR